MPIVVQKEWFTREQVQAEKDKIFVFGDNLTREGTGGQAKACRGEYNTIGIVTKWDKFQNPGSYMYDTTYAMNVAQIEKDFQNVAKILGDRDQKDKIIVFPADGFGTGLANLKLNAPKTLEFIELITEYYLACSVANEADLEVSRLGRLVWPKDTYRFR